MPVQRNLQDRRTIFPDQAVESLIGLGGELLAAREALSQKQRGRGENVPQRDISREAGQWRRWLDRLGISWSHADRLIIIYEHCRGSLGLSVAGG